jgi:hypothetical protein
MLLPFSKSVPGRLLYAAAACYLLAGAAQVIAASQVALGIGMPAAVTISFVAVGLGMADYPREILLSVCVLPPALWGFLYLMGELTTATAVNWGYGMAALGVVALLFAAAPRGDEADA